jgi:hypothetical protein
VIDNCDGSYLVRYEAPRAKPYVVTVSLAGSCIKFTGDAEPGHVHLPSCTLKVTPSSLKVRRSSAHGGGERSDRGALREEVVMVGAESEG